MSISYEPLLILLVKKRLKKTDLQKMANLTPNTVAKFARGEPIRLDVLERICRALGCEPGDVFKYVDEEENDGQS